MKHTTGKLEIIALKNVLRICEAGGRNATFAIVDTETVPYEEMLANAILIKNSPLILELLKEASQVILSEVPKNNKGVRALLEKIDNTVSEIEL